MDAKVCPRGQARIRGRCYPKNKFVSLGTHDKGEMFVRYVGNKEFIAFYLSFDYVPQVEGLTVPTTKKDLNFHFNMKI